FQRSTSAKNARFDGAHAAFKNFGDLFIAQSFEIAKNDGAAKDVGNLVQRILHHRLDFARSELVKWSRVHIFNLELALALFRFRVDRNILLQMTLEPAAMVEGFANSDAVKPSLQRAALAKMANPFEGFKKNFLRAVCRVGRIGQHAEN